MRSTSWVERIWMETEQMLSCYRYSSPPSPSVRHVGQYTTLNIWISVDATWERNEDPKLMSPVVFSLSLLAIWATSPHCTLSKFLQNHEITKLERRIQWWTSFAAVITNTNETTHLLSFFSSSMPLPFLSLAQSFSKSFAEESSSLLFYTTVLKLVGSIGLPWWLRQ